MKHDMLSNIPIAIVLFGVLLFFYLYYYFAHSSWIENLISKKSEGDRAKVLLFTSRKSLGVLFLGLLPFVLYFWFVSTDTALFGLSFEKFAQNLGTILILAGIILTVLLLNQLADRNRNSFQIKIKNWTAPLLAINTGGWILYLISYEFLFRGILLMACYQHFGFWPAIAVNVVLYSAIHMVNGKSEAIGALVFGTIACYFMLTRETLLIPILMHVTLSVFSDLFSLALNPELRLVKASTLKSKAK